jgi:predicted ATPase/DNA-binding CsgD family transcriptional regulator
LLTLTGTGGTGKTRLALALAATLRDSFADGIWFVDLSATIDPFLVTPAIAQVLGVREAGQQAPLETLKQAVRDRQLLLVLDNFEQVVTAAAEVAELLTAAPGLKVLVTSRTPLHISGEHEFPVPPLGLPDPTRPATSEGLSQSEAVALFIQRAEAARPDFQVTSQNAPAVAEICVCLDGLPLAIELAAARIKLLPPQALLGRLSNRLQLLTGGARDRPVRQQTLRGTIDWSYGLLDEGEQMLFRRLAVFSGGCTLEAAEAICVGDAHDVDVLEGLAALVDQQLLRQEEASGEPRFGMLETVREYALWRLENSSEAEELRQRHARHFLALAERAEPELRGPQQRAWLDRLEREHANLRAALGWVLERGEAETALRLSSALRWFWEQRGYLGEGLRWLERALAEGAGAPTPVRAKAHNAAGGLAWPLQRYEAAAAHLQECLALGRTLGDQQLVARALGNLGSVAYERGDLVGTAALYEESLAVFRELGDTQGVTIALSNLGLVATQQGEYGRATALLMESLSLSRELGDEWRIALALANQGEVALRQGEHGEATARYGEALALFRSLRDPRLIAITLDGLARTAAARGQPARATRLFGAAEAARERIGTLVDAPERPVYDTAVAGVRARLGETAFTAAWAEGRAMSLEQAMDYALATEGPAPATGGKGATEAADPWVPLTPREREVAALVARGLTNRRIAEELVITEGTAELHVVHILNKLGFHSRVQIATWFAERAATTARALGVVAPDRGERR